MTAVLVAVTGVAVLVTAYIGGPGVALEGASRGLQHLLQATPLLVAAFLLSGAMGASLDRERLSSWVGREAGFRGVLAGWLAGSLMPGGPYVYYPLALALREAGMSTPVLVAFILGKQLSNVERLLVEYPLLGPQLTSIRFALSVIIPPLAGLAVAAAERRRLRAWAG